MNDIEKLEERRKKVGSLGSIDFLIELEKKREKSKKNIENIKTRQPLVTVIMSAYNSEKTISESIKSITEQSYKNIELIIVNDCSNDKTYEISKSFVEFDNRIKIYSNSFNRGTYWSRNFAITRSSGELITCQDSDDLSDPHRIEIQVNQFIENEDLVFCTCNCDRIDEKGKQISKSKLCYPAIMYKKNVVVNKIGYFDSVRVSADSEFYERSKLVFSKRSERKHLAINLVKQLYREGSLTLCSTESLRIDFKRDEGKLPKDRAQYIKSFKEWHEKISQNKVSPYLDFPLIKRPFDAPDSMRIDNINPEAITASVASMPSRVENLKVVVEKILPQIDRLYVYLNEYDTVPDFLKNKKIFVSVSQDHGDLADNGKFFFRDKIKNCIHFTIDDDILYPDNYVQEMLLALQKYNYNAIIGVHGVLLSEPMESFYKNRTVFTFKSGLNCDHFVNLLGTGTICFYDAIIDFSSDKFTTKRMVDLWVAIEAKKAQIPLVCISRKGGWLTQQQLSTDYTIFKTYTNSDSIQTDLALKNRPWGHDGLVKESVLSSYLGSENLSNPIKYEIASLSQKQRDKLYYNSSLTILLIGRFDTWKKGGIHKSCTLIADILKDRGHEVLTLDTKKELPKTLPRLDIAWIYPGDPRRPDYKTVDKKILQLQKSGVPVIVNFSHINTPERSAWIVDRVTDYNMCKDFPLVYNAVFSNSAHSDPILKQISDFTINIPKTITLEPVENLPSYSKREGICIGDAAKIFNSDIIGGKVDTWIDALSSSLPDVNLYVYRQYSGDKLHPKLTYAPYMDKDFGKWLSERRMFICLNQHLTFEMVPCEAQSVGTPVIYRDMPQSLNQYLGFSGLHVLDPVELAEMCAWMYLNETVWCEYSSISLYNSKVTSVDNVGVQLETALRLALSRNIALRPARYCSVKK